MKRGDIMILPGAEPFIYRGSEDKGVLLIHGFTGSPSEMRLYGMALRDAGYTVLGIRLPGHGTSVEDMEHTTADDWMRAALDGYDMMSGLVRHVAVAGLSMGALLSLWLATVRPVWRVASLAAPIMIRAERDLHLLPPRAEARGKFLPKAPKLLKGVPKEYRLCYDAIPLLSVHELLEVISRVKGVLGAVRSPLIVMQSERDHTVNVESARYIMEHVGSSEKELFFMRRSGHRITVDVEREDVFQKTIEFLNKGSDTL